MANTKTFKTRIKLKYDSAANWLPNGNKFPGLKGELLIGSDDRYLRIGNGTGWDYAKISGAEVDIAGYSINTIKTAQAAITNLDSRINDIVTDGVVTKFGERTGAITLNGASGLVMNDNQLSINPATTDKFGVVKVNANNGLAISDGTISMGLASASDNGAMSVAHFTKLEGIESGAEVNIIEAVQVNSTGLTPDGNRAVNITIAEGSANGTILVNEQPIAVHGLGSAAYTEASDYQAKFTDGSATVATFTNNTLTLTSVSQSGGKISDGDTITTLTFASTPTDTNKIVTQSDISGIVGAMVYQGTVTIDNPLPEVSTDNKGHVYVVEEDGFEHGDKTAQVGDMFVSNGTSWDLIQGNVNVTNNGATLEVGGGAANIATVEGVTITAKVTASADKVNYGENSNVKAALDSLNTAVGQNSTDIDAVEVRMDAAEGAIDALEALVGNSSVDNQITAKINALNTNGETIASVSNDEVTLSKTITQTNGVIDIADTNNTITLAKVAKTGAASNVTVADANGNYSTNDVESVLNEIATSINSLESNIGTGSVASQITGAINALDGSATIASVANDIVTLNAGITEADGVISNSTGADITLAKVAKTGTAADVAFADTSNNYEATTVEGALNEILTWEFVFDCGNATDNNVTPVQG